MSTPESTRGVAMTMDPSSGRTSRCRVLLVDDDVLLQEAILLLLRHLGREARVASSGEEALDLLAGGLAPDLVILDMDMPGMGGAITLEGIRAGWPLLPVVISTGRPTPEVNALVHRYPHVGLLPKPYTTADLRAHLA